MSDSKWSTRALRLALLAGLVVTTGCGGARSAAPEPVAEPVAEAPSEDDGLRGLFQGSGYDAETIRQGLAAIPRRDLAGADRGAYWLAMRACLFGFPAVVF